MKEKSFLQQQAYDTIKSSILSGEMEPNRLYSETKLSAQIGISRTPVREALQCLSQDGYITVIPSKGFMIRQLNDKDMKDSIEIRCAIEGFCTNMVASQIDTEKGRQLLHSLEKSPWKTEFSWNTLLILITSFIFCWWDIWKTMSSIRFSSAFSI